MTWRGSNTPTDRLVSFLVYGLPLSSGAGYGIFLLQKLPLLGRIIYLLLSPFLFVDSLINGLIPGGYGRLVIFFALLLLVVRNPSIRHFVRFNIMQAILIMIAVSICSLVFSLFGITLTGLSLNSNFLVEVVFTTIFLGVFAACVYSMIRAIQGLYPEIPVISDATYSQVPR